MDLKQKYLRYLKEKLPNEFHDFNKIDSYLNRKAVTQIM